MQSSPRNQAKDMESIRHEISQLRGVLDFVKEDVSQKSYEMENQMKEIYMALK